MTLTDIPCGPAEETCTDEEVCGSHLMVALAGLDLHHLLEGAS